MRRKGGSRSPVRRQSVRTRCTPLSTPKNRQRVAESTAPKEESDNNRRPARNRSRSVRRGRLSPSREHREGYQRSSSRNRNSRHRRSHSLGRGRFVPETYEVPLTPNPDGKEDRHPRDDTKKSKSSPRRRFSNDATGDLSNFLSQNASVSRRIKPHGGSKSVTGPLVPMVRKSRRGSAAGSQFNEFDSKVPEMDSENFPEMDSDIDSENEIESRRTDTVEDQDRKSETMQLLIQTDNLLYSVFPKHIADDLRAGRKVEPTYHDNVTIFFSDIVGFTELASEMDPLKVSNMLDRLYHSFDALSHYHDIFKVETIGDAYMAVTNLVKDQDEDHAKRIAEFAIDAIRVAKQTLIDAEDPEKGFVRIRVGFHSGPVVSNVVGSRNPRYCLFGDTVNLSSRMESNSSPSRIHCSDTSAHLLQEQAPEIKLFPRGQIEIKGKGLVNSYWVNEEGGKEQESFLSKRSIFKSFRKHQRP